MLKRLIEWTDTIQRMAIYLSVFLTPFLFFWKTDELFEFNKMLFIYGLVTAGLTALGVKSIVWKRLALRRTRFDIPLALFVASQVLATIFSIHPYTSWWGYYSRFNGGLLSILAYTSLYYLATQVIRNKDLPILFFFLIFGLLGSSLYALPEHFGHSPSCLLLTGQFTADCWRQDVQHRVFGTFGQPNWLAAYSIGILPLALILAVGAVGKQKTNRETVSAQRADSGYLKVNQHLRLLALATLLVGYPVLLFTKSRSGFLGLAISFTLLGGGLLLSLIRAGSETQTGSKPTSIFNRNLLNFSPLKTAAMQSFFKKIGLIALILIGFSLYFGTPFSPSSTELLENRSGRSTPTPETTQATLDFSGTDSGEIRKIVWSGALKVWQRYPLVGSGVETFAYSYYKDRPFAHNFVSEWDFLYNKAHNEFLNHLATTGILGLGSYLLLLSWFGILILRTVFFTPLLSQSDLQQKKTLVDWILLALLAGMVALAISNFFGFSTVMVMVIIFTYLALTDVLLEQVKSLVSADHVQVSPAPSSADPSEAQKKSRTDSPRLVSFLEKDPSRPPLFLNKPLTLAQKVAILLVIGVGLLNGVGLWNRWRADILFAQGKSYIREGYIKPGILKLTQAALLQPREALFYDELANGYARLAFNTADTLDDLDVLDGLDNLSDLDGQLDGQSATESSTESREDLPADDPNEARQAADEQANLLSSQAAEYAQAAVDASDIALALNPVHLNFYKTRARVFRLLSLYNQKYLETAAETIEAARQLAPTDPRLVYELAVIREAQQKSDQAIELAELAVELRPAYEEARMQLAALYEQTARPELALEQYRYIVTQIAPSNEIALDRIAVLEVK